MVLGPAFVLGAAEPAHIALELGDVRIEGCEALVGGRSPVPDRLGHFSDRGGEVLQLFGQQYASEFLGPLGLVSQKLQQVLYGVDGGHVSVGPSADIVRPGDGVAKGRRGLPTVATPVDFRMLKLLTVTLRFLPIEFEPAGLPGDFTLICSYGLCQEENQPGSAQVGDWRFTYQDRTRSFRDAGLAEGDAALSDYAELFGRVERILFAQFSAGVFLTSLKNSFLIK